MKAAHTMAGLPNRTFPDHSSGPRVLAAPEEYARRLESRKASVDRCERQSAAIAYARLASGIAAIVTAILIFWASALPPAWLALPVGIYIVLAVVHDRVLRKQRRCARGVSFYGRGLARLNNQWAGSGESGLRFLNPLHTYAADLDIFGKASLFEKLCAARTHAGEEMLARWLTEPAPPPVVLLRQQAIAELRPCLDIREDLAVLGEELRSAAVSESFAAWGEVSPKFANRVTRVVGAVLAGAAVIAFAVWAVWGIWQPALVLVLINSIFLMANRKRIERAVEEAEHSVHDLDVVSQIFARIERESFTGEHLTALRSGLDAEGHLPSIRIAQLKRRMDLLESHRHWLVALLEFIILWTFHSVYAVEAWRKSYGPLLRRWLAVLAEFEALSSLAGYAYEHPGDTFPEFTEGSPGFQAEGLAHPLLSETKAVRNDLKLGDDLRLLVVSGSNMSGKSTLLRAVGINTVLAQCGAPVRARRLRLTPLAVGASIRTADSLQEGVSRFYAEIQRVQQVVELTRGELPVLFLFDEFLQGTNSFDRRIGAEAIMRGLIQRGAIGLLTTHDLSLAEIADSIGAGAANIHFEDRLENGKLFFDYHLRPGVVRRSNALDLMRSVGLEV